MEKGVGIQKIVKFLYGTTNLKIMIYFLGNVQSTYGRGKDKKKRKSILPYLVPAVGGGIASLGGRTVKGKIIRGLGGAALTGGALLGAKKLDDANNSGKLRGWGSKVGLNNYKKKKK